LDPTNGVWISINLGVDPVQYSILRMGEMHLIYAEALAETGNLQKACEEVNKVRAPRGTR